MKPRTIRPRPAQCIYAGAKIYRHVLGDLRTCANCGVRLVLVRDQWMHP